MEAERETIDSDRPLMSNMEWLSLLRKMAKVISKGHA
jgi:hypothetical protein